MVLIMALIGSVITSCSNADEPLPEPTTSNDEGASYEVSINFAGEYTEITEEPLGRADEESPKKFYGINVYCMKTDGSESAYSRYAYGVFDNIADMRITLLGGYKYKFECTSATEGDDLFYKDSSYLYRPFTTSEVFSSGDDRFYKSQLNNFITSQSYYLNGIQLGNTYDNFKSTKIYPRMDRYYGELTDFIPSEGGVANIPMKRTVFGLKIIVNGVPDGTLRWTINSLYTNKTCTGSDIVEVSTIYTFYEVKKCWETDTYSQDFTISFTWTRSNGYKQYFSEDFTAKRNVMTTINVNLKGGANDISLGIVEEDTPMESEEISIDYDGGDMNDTPVNPEE